MAPSRLTAASLFTSPYSAARTISTRYTILSTSRREHLRLLPPLSLVMGGGVFHAWHDDIEDDVVVATFDLELRLAAVLDGIHLHKGLGGIHGHGP